MPLLDQLFGLHGRTALVTGASGALGSVMAHGLAQAGAAVGVIGRRAAECERVAAAIRAAGGTALALPADVLQRDQLNAVEQRVMAEWGRIDILVNAAGGNMPSATLPPGASFFNLPVEGVEPVLALNLQGTLLPVQVFGAAMAAQRKGCIINVSSMAAQRALTRVFGYGLAKSAIDNATRWLAVELARSFGPGLRVNAIAPGFFVGDQNRALLLEADGTPTARGRQIIAHTPAGRFGSADELVSTLLWLVGDGAAFVNGIVVAVDGGFSAYSGV